MGASVKLRYCLLLLLVVAILPLFSENAVRTDYEIRRSVFVRASLFYGLSARYGFLVSADGGTSWERRSDGLPVKMVYPFSGEETITLTGLSFDPAHPRKVMVTTADSVWESCDAGLSWKEITLKSPVKKSAYITAAAAHPQQEGRYAVATSFSGIFETLDNGAHWTIISDSLKEIYKGAGFHDEINALMWEPESGNRLLAMCGFSRKLYARDTQSGQWDSLSVPDGGQPFENMGFVPAGDNAWDLTIATADTEYRHTVAENMWRVHARKNVKKQDGNPSLRQETAAGKYGIYLNANSVGNSRFDEHVAFMKEHGINSFVVDMKDDQGRITYDTRLNLPETQEAVLGTIKLETALKKAHKAGLYVIGRIVVFKDKKLYHFDKGKYAVWDKYNQAPWGRRFKVTDKKTGQVSYEQREFWTDPFSEGVWDYNIALARELQDRGIDEIQFDYIRLPTDGDLTRAEYRYKKKGMRPLDALESFLRKARENLSLPISTDLYGFNSWYHMGNWNGQNLDMFADYVDVVSPMFYPSHFPHRFLEDLSYFDKAERIYTEGSDRAAEIVGERCVIRPYVQAFLMGAELKFEMPDYTEYLRRQLTGVEQSGASGFTLWNNSNRYYMVNESLLPFTRN